MIVIINLESIMSKLNTVKIGGFYMMCLIYYHGLWQSGSKRQAPLPSEVANCLIWIQ